MAPRKDFYCTPRRSRTSSDQSLIHYKILNSRSSDQKVWPRTTNSMKSVSDLAEIAIGTAGYQVISSCLTALSFWYDMI